LIESEIAKKRDRIVGLSTNVTGKEITFNCDLTKEEQEDLDVQKT